MKYSIQPNSSFIFFPEAFLTGYVDDGRDNPCEVIILSLPDEVNGILNYNEIPVVVNQVFEVCDATNLSFLRTNFGAFEDSFNFKVSDNKYNKEYSKTQKVSIIQSAYML